MIRSDEIDFDKLRHLQNLIGNTPCIKLRNNRSDVYAKLECLQFSGSAKIRPAVGMVTEAIRSGKLNENSVIVESTSGNLGIALALLSARMRIKFVPIIDPNISRGKREILECLCKEIVYVKDLDVTGGYLLSRLARVKAFLEERPNSYWTNQYENPMNYRSYFGLADECMRQVENVGAIFVGVSSCGCITGISQRIKEINPKIKIIAVDVEGSLVFCDRPKPRNIPGLGASKRSVFLRHATIDDVVILSEDEIISGAHSFLEDQGLLLGASSGAVYAASKRYLSNSPVNGSVVLICPDDGRDYMSSVYSKSKKDLFQFHQNQEVLGM